MVWNCLPADVVLCPSIATFKFRLTDIIGHHTDTAVRLETFSFYYRSFHHCTTCTCFYQCGLS